MGGRDPLKITRTLEGRYHANIISNILMMIISLIPLCFAVMGLIGGAAGPVSP